MHKIPQKLGFWSALTCLALFVIFTICFMLVLARTPLITWHGLEQYLHDIEGTEQQWKYIAQLSMMLFAPAFVVLLNSIHSLASPEKKALSRLGLIFGALFALQASMHYFLQLSTVRLNIMHGETAGLEHYIQLNPGAALLAMNMVGWTLFLGLATLFAAPAIEGTGSSRIARWAFRANTLFCFTGGYAFITDNAALVNISINMGMGLTIMVSCIALLFHFRQKNLVSLA